MLASFRIAPGVEDFYILDHFVRRDFGDLIQGQMPLGIGLSAFLHHEIGFPILRLSRDFGFEDLGYCAIRTFAGHSL